MKTNSMVKSGMIILLLFAALSWNAHSQQWKPISSTEKFNYRIDSAAYITNVITVDSAKIQGVDSVFYLNRIVTPCPACSNQSWRLYNQPQFLQRKMIMETGGVYLFSDPGRFWIRTLAGLNATWVFDSSASINAQVTAFSYEQVLSQWDSVKTISLSDGGIIRLSKNHGILRFPVMGSVYYYLLEGIAGRNLGTLVPGFREIFNYNVGDVFQYSFLSINYGIGYGTEGLTKKTIVSKDSSSSGYLYGVAVSTMSWTEYIIGYGYDTIHYYSNSTDTILDSVTHSCNLNPLELIMNPVFPLYVSGPNASIMKVFRDTGQSVSRCQGKNYYSSGEEAPLYGFGAGDTLEPSFLAYMYQEKFTTGIGRVIFELGIFETEVNEYLIGYIKNGVTTGTVYSNDFLLQKIGEQKTDGPLRLFPNPAKDRLIVETSGTDFPYLLSILNMTGQEQITQQVSEQTKVIDISNLPVGIYFARLKSDKAVNIGKFVKE
ncbi:MAG: T9SS type A sorting domain-containing protein [Bacteroidetes bacterium]|nr:T9SS type A sorting domain-containing protein [Bacteroidota bacterium]